MCIFSFGAASIEVCTLLNVPSLCTRLPPPHHRQGRELDTTAVALVVDHSLRPESAAEAAAVAHTAAQLGLQPHVLRVGWTHGKPRPQDKLAAARDARYAVLLETCARLGCTHLLVAHHAGQ